MNCSPLQLDLFDADAELSVIGITRNHLEAWHRQDLLSFDPQTPRLERWQLQEIAFLYHLTKVEPSANALRKLLAPLKRPYLLDHGRHFFNFKTLQWERRYCRAQQPCRDGDGRTVGCRSKGYEPRAGRKRRLA